MKTADGTVIPNVELTLDIDGNITHPTTDSNGQISIPLDYLTIGTHTASLSFGGNNLYEPANKEATITVTKIPTKIECEREYEVEYNESYTIVITVKHGETNVPLNGLLLTVDLAGNITNLTTDENGQIKIETQNLSAGTYGITISFNGTEYCSKASRTITLEVYTQETHFEVEDMTTSHQSGEKWIATLKNNQGNPISGEKVKVSIRLSSAFEDRIEYNLTTDENGQIAVPTNEVPLGTYLTYFIFNGNENYDSEVGEANIIINKYTAIFSADNITSSPGEDKYLTITLKDDLNRAIPNAKIKVFIKEFEEKTTDENGTVKISTKGLEPNNYNVAILYGGNKNYSQAFSMVNINITKSVPTATEIVISPSATITYNKAIDSENDYYFYATLKDANGNVLADKTLLYTADGKTYSAKTDSNGQIKFLVAQADKGKCNVAVSFLGDDNNTGCFKSISVKIDPQKAKLVAKKKTIKAKKKSKLTATLKNSKGKAIAGKKITFTVNKKSYTAKTNKKGVATVKVKLSKKKTYKVTVKFAGDNTYNKATTKTSVKVK